MEQTLWHTCHSRIRSQQRGITESMILDTIHYGQMIRKQGLKFYIMTEKCLNYIQERQYSERLKNTIVILTSENVILTVYKNADGIRAIKKKSKIYIRKT